MTESQQRYSMVIEWSDEDAAYIVSFPEWAVAGHLAHTHGETYVDAARKGEEMLDFLVWSAREGAEPMPVPRQFDFVARHSPATSGGSTRGAGAVEEQRRERHL